MAIIIRGDVKGDVIGEGGVKNETHYHYGKEEGSMTNADKDIRAAPEELLEAKDESGEPIFRNKKQWWAVYRVLAEYCNFPSKMTAFVAKMKDMELKEVDEKRKLTYDSLSAAPKELPLMATCAPSNWGTLKDRSENYRQQYEVADFLMLKLGIKS